MARRKTAKRSAKRTTTHSSSSPTLRIEKEFLGTPAKLAAQLAKEVKAHKQKESKLKSAVAKSKSKVKNSETKLKHATKQKTPAGKKLLVGVKKSHGRTLQLHATLEKQLKDASQLLTSATTRHAKLVALRKNLSQFEKDWNSQAKKLKTKTKAKAKPKAKTKKYTQTKSKLDNQNQPQQDSYETVNDLFRIDESETTS